MKFCTNLVMICLLAIGCSKNGSNAVTPVKTNNTPGAPLAQTAAAGVTATSFTASWQKVAGADKYQVFVAADGQFTQPLSGFNPASVTDTSLAVTNLNPGSTYFYKVQASEKGVTGAFSNVIPVTTQAVKALKWQTVGSADFSGGGVEYNTALAIDNNNRPYIAYQDAGYNGAATVMVFNGSAWTTVGSAGFSDAQIGLISITIDKSSNTPYVAYRDFDGYFAVQKFVSGSWTMVGDALTLPIEGQPSLAIDKNGNPYIGIIDYNVTDKATVMEFNGSSWVLIGNEGFSANNALSFISIAVDGNGKVYAAYDNGHGSVVETFNGGAWGYVGQPLFNNSSSSYTTLAIDHNNSLYVGYAGSGQIGNPECMKYNGSYWAQIGSDFSGYNYYPSFSVDYSGNPYLAFQQNTDAYHSVTVMKNSGGTWTELGNTSFSGGYIGALNSGTIPWPPSIAIDGNNVVYVGYADDNVNSRATVMKLVQ